MEKRLCVGLLLMVSGAVQAGTCEQDFQTVGDPRNGLLVLGEVKKPGLSISSALGQMQQYALDGGYQVGNESIKGDTGELFITQTNTRPPILINIQANRNGQVTMGTKFPRGIKIDPAEARREICSMLGKIKTGKEGESIAASARARTGSGQVIDITAPKLSAEVGNEVRKAMRGVNSKGAFKNAMLGTNEGASAGERREAFAPIIAKYKGRKYRIDGQIYTISRNQFNDELNIAYLVTPNRGLLGIRQSSTFNNLNFTIKCTLAPDQARFFLTLSEGDSVTLQGTVDQIDESGMSLEGCRQAN